jgi:hypothetical protein
MLRTRLLRAVVCAIAATSLPLAFPSAAAPQALGETTVVSTLSGTGELGFADGSNGTFLMPTGLAYDAAGRLYVSDGAAQRIRRIDPDGSVRTIAGGGALDSSGFWVTGGYADGRGTAARFDRPAGIAIRSDGTIYVADTLNHCIRAIDVRGDVTTYAGSPSAPGHVDGPRSTARFGDPTGLAVDHQGDLFVADYTGIREIDPAGNVTTIPSLGNKPYAVAVFDGPREVTVFAGDQDGIVARRLGRSPSEDRGFSREGIPNAERTLTTAAEQPLGEPAFLAAIDENTVAYTELRTNTIRSLEIISGQTALLAGTPSENGSGDTGGYADGPGPAAKFFTPLGIARAPDGGLVVADGGNRRVRKLSPTERVDPWGSLEVAFPGVAEHPDPSEYRIAYVGDSYIYYGTDWATSIEGLLQDRLAVDPGLRALGKHPKIVPIIKLANAEFRNFATLAALTGFYDFVVLNINLGNVYTTYENEHRTPDLAGADWPAELTRTLVDISRTLSAKNIGFLVIVHPVPTSFAPSEGTWYPIAEEFAPPYAMAPDARAMRRLEDAIMRSGVPAVDVTPEFTAEEAASPHVPLFGTADYHFTRRARAIIANAVAARLHAMAPWRR